MAHAAGSYSGVELTDTDASSLLKLRTVERFPWSSVTWALIVLSWL